MNSISIFGQMVVLLAMMMLGYIAFRKGILNEDVSTRLSKLVVNFFNPFLIINCVLDGTQIDAQEKMIQNFVLIVAYFAILVAFSFVLVRILRPIPQERLMYVLMTDCANIAYIGIPIAKSLYGNEAAVYVAFYVLGFSIFLYTYGVFLANRIGSQQENGKQTVQPQMSMMTRIKKIMNPGVISCIAAALISALKIQMPAPFVSFCSSVGGGTIPLAMMLIGASLAQAGFADTLKEWRVYAFILIRMVALPIFIYYVTLPLPIDRVVQGVFMLEFTMPVAAVVTPLVEEKGANTTCCMRGTILTTLASVVTIPIVCMLTVG